MTDRTHTALARLGALIAFAFLLAIFACRPVWSPDSKKLLFPCRQGESLVIAVFDRETGKAEVVFAPPGGEGLAVPLWTPDGKGAVIAWASEKKRKRLAVTTMAIPASGTQTTVEFTTREDASRSLAAPPVLLGRRLFFVSDDITRIDLDSGESRQLATADNKSEIVLAARGTGLCYMASAGREATDWELGTVDPDTLEMTRLFSSPATLPWHVQPLPAFSPDLSRIAMVAQSLADDGEVAILVFRNGAIETVLPVGRKGAVELDGVAWSPDGVTLYAGLSRRADDGASTQWALYETTISGSVVRETSILQRKGPAKRRKLETAAFFALAVSPDGKTAAFSTALLDDIPEGDHDHGLYLVDLAAKDRTITHVPLPQPRELTLTGSDTMLELASRWAEGWLLERPTCPVHVSGGGTGTGFKSLIDGDADFAMVSRPARPAEIEQATERGAALREHRVAFDAIAVFVHKDNPIASITMEQLAAVFGESGVTRWSELGVTMAADRDAIAPAGLPNNSGTHQFFREAVLGRRAAGRHISHMQGAKDVVGFVAKDPGGIGYAGVAYGDDTVKVIPVIGAAGAVPSLPTQASIGDGSYPLARPLFLYTRGEPVGDRKVFLAWLASEPGRQATRQAGYLAPQ